MMMRAFCRFPALAWAHKTICCAIHWRSKFSEMPPLAISFDWHRGGFLGIRASQDRARICQLYSARYLSE